MKTKKTKKMSVITDRMNSMDQITDRKDPKKKIRNRDIKTHFSQLLFRPKNFLFYPKYFYEHFVCIQSNH